MANRFQSIKDKKILIYGTGKIAESLIDFFNNFQVVGVIDRVKFSGEKCGLPILMWDDLQPGDADVIVIAASKRYYPEIYQRIIEKCISFGLQIYGANGEDLIHYFGLGMNQYQDFRYYDKNAKELNKILLEYDIISFDIFDTLIMRKTLEPADIFDIVEMRLKSVGIILKKFKAIRRQAELLSNGQSIYVIYDILQKMTGISDEWKTRILVEELKCEKDFIIARKAMVDIFDNVVASGKKVYLISDMYFTADILTDILKHVGITGYEKIYVSCEHGVGKENGLFQKLCKEIGNHSCIHIGDNEGSDVRAALRYGLNAYGINSAFDMLHRSSLHYVLGFTNNSNDKNLIGLIISELFNNPFSLYHTSGMPRISLLGEAGKIMLAPVAVGYMSLLLNKLKREKYDGILFVARDEYFFKKLYDILLKSTSDKVPSYYIYSSRKLSIRLGMNTIKDIEDVLNNIFSIQINDILYEWFGVKCLEQDMFKGSKEHVYLYKKEIKKHSQITRENYKKYLESMGINLKKKYLLCELDGRGTSHYYLNNLFKQGLNSFYLAREHCMDDFYQLKSEAMYDFWSVNCEYNSINENTAFIESIFSAPHPTVEDMEEDGKPIFAEEIRSEEQIEMMQKMQDAIENFCVEYFETMYIEGKPINIELPIRFLDLFPYINYEGECEVLYRGSLYDEMTHSYLSMIPGKE